MCLSLFNQARYFENPQVIAENTVPSPEMVGMITSVLVKTAPEREDSETRTVSYEPVCKSLHLHCRVYTLYFYSTVYNHLMVVMHCVDTLSGETTNLQLT